jgi:hypothetical protein
MLPPRKKLKSLDKRMNQIRILLKILLLQATAIIHVIRLSNYGNFRTVGALSSPGPGLPTSQNVLQIVSGHRRRKRADHQKALIAPKEHSNMDASINRVVTKEENGIVIALKAVYFMAQEGIPLSKYGKFINLLKYVGTPDFEIWDGLPLSVTLFDEVFSC